MTRDEFYDDRPEEDLTCPRCGKGEPKEYEFVESGRLCGIVVCDTCDWRLDSILSEYGDPRVYEAEDIAAEAAEADDWLPEHP
jgi:hypothetical protein